MITMTGSQHPLDKLQRLEGEELEKIRTKILQLLIASPEGELRTD